MSGDVTRLADTLAGRLRGGMPANVALMLLLNEAPSPEAASAAIDLAAREPGLADTVEAVQALHRAHPDAWETVRAAAVRHGTAPRAATGDAALAHWRDSFDRLAETAPEAGVALYALGDPALLAAATAEVVAALDEWGLVGPDRDALDLGCGMGRFAAALAPRLRSVLGLDLSARMVEEARRRNRHTNARFAVGSGRDLAGCATRGFDLVLAADVFPYLVGADLAEAHVAELARVLRPGGAAVILNYSYRGDPGRDRADVLAAAGRHGFAVRRDGARPFRLWDAAAFQLDRTG